MHNHRFFCRLFVNKTMASGYFKETRQKRDVAKEQIFETLQTLIDDENTPNSQKDKAAEAYKNLALRIDSESKLEAKIKSLGFGDVVCFMDSNKVKVYVETKKELTEKQIAEIKEVVIGQTGIKDVEITTKK